MNLFLLCVLKISRISSVWESIKMVISQIEILENLNNFNRKFWQFGLKVLKKSKFSKILKRKSKFSKFKPKNLTIWKLVWKNSEIKIFIFFFLKKIHKVWQVKGSLTMFSLGMRKSPRRWQENPKFSGNKVTDKPSWKWSNPRFFDFSQILSFSLIISEFLNFKISKFRSFRVSEFLKFQSFRVSGFKVSEFPKVSKSQKFQSFRVSKFSKFQSFEVSEFRISSFKF